MEIVTAEIRDSDAPLDPAINVQYLSNVSLRGDAFLEPTQKQSSREIVCSALEDAAVNLHTGWSALQQMDDNDVEREGRRLAKSSKKLTAVSDRLRKECAIAHRAEEINAVRAKDKRYDMHTSLLLDAMELEPPSLSCLCVVRYPQDVEGLLSWLDAGPYLGFLATAVLPGSRVDLTPLRDAATVWVRTMCSGGVMLPFSFRSRHERERSLLLFPSGVLLLQQLVKCMEKYVKAERRANRKGETRSVFQLLTSPDPEDCDPELLTASDMRAIFLARQKQIHSLEPDGVLAGLQVLLAGGHILSHFRNVLSWLHQEMYSVNILDTDPEGRAVTLRIALDPLVRYPEDFPVQLPPYTPTPPCEVPPLTEWDRFGGGDEDKVDSDDE
jgi:hypothetical protein